MAAWCMNDNCRKTGLRKEDIEFDEELHAVLCHGCYSLRHPGWVPPVREFVDMTDSVPKVVRILPSAPRIGFAIQISDHDGVRAQLSYGGATLNLHAPVSELARLVGG